MSLLMDALKKAEQAKAQASDQTSDQTQSPSSAPDDGLLPETQALAALPDAGDAPAVAAPEALDVTSADQTEERLDNATDGVELSLDEVEVLAPVYLEKPEQVPAAEVLTSDEADPSLAQPSEIAPESETSPVVDQPIQPVASEATGSSHPSTEEKSDAVATATTAPRQVAAEAVTTGPEAAQPETAGTESTDAQASGAEASKTAPRAAAVLVGQRKFNRTYLWAGLVVLMALVGIGYYLKAVLAPMPVSSVVPAALPHPSEEAVGEAAPLPPETEPAPPAEATAAPAAPRPSPAPVAQTAKVSQAARVESRAEAVTPARQVVTPAATRASPVPKRALVIQRNEVEDPLFSQLQQAYEAYQQGDFKQAEARYRQVFMRDNSNRDALLGLAAIAQQDKRPEDARRFYRRLLSLNPKDSRAAAGLMALSAPATGSRNITQLKLMLSEEPTAAYLYFALGNAYAARSLWPEAQQAYFNAYRYAPERGEYAFNLAVSLEHIGQPQAALTYYLQAQQALTHESSPGFSVDQLAQRIAALRMLGER